MVFFVFEVKVAFRAIVAFFEWLVMHFAIFGLAYGCALLVLLFGCDSAARAGTYISDFEFRHNNHLVVN